jgi:hypothetical protein
VRRQRSVHAIIQAAAASGRLLSPKSDAKLEALLQPALNFLEDFLKIP